jgi:RHS repeat-associated protein
VNWDEAQATSVNRLTGTPWNVAYVGLNDIDAKSTYESTILFQSGQTNTWKSWDITALTQKWVNGTATNYGVVLWATNETTDGYDLRFRSSEYATTSERPYLQVTYSTSAKTVYFLKDHLGSIRATVDNTGAVVGYDDYDPWGFILANRSLATPWSSVQGTAKNKFTGKEFDDDFGLNWLHLGWRPYDSQIARFFIVDPLWQKHPDVSPYAYVLNNPLILVDPDGRQVHFGFAQGVAVAGGADPNRILAAQNRGALQGAAIGSGISATILGGAYVAGAFGPELLTGFLANAPRINRVFNKIIEAFSEAPEGAFVDDAAGALLKSGNLDIVTESIESVKEFLKPGGKLIGEAGSSPNIRILTGSLDDAKALFEQLSQGGKSIDKNTFPGRAVEFPEGGFVGLRTFSTKSGKNVVATIDVNIKGLEEIKKIKFIVNE